MRCPDSSADAVVLRIGGTFDMTASRKLCDALIAAARVQIVVDLTRVGELHDGALAHLCHAVALLRGRVQIRGVRDLRRSSGSIEHASARRRQRAALGSAS